MIGLDIETAGTEDGYALQPWRVFSGEAWITSVAVAKPGGQSKLVTTKEEIAALLKSLEGRTCVLWNGIFDLAFLIASGHEVSKINWLDAMLLWKWVENSQRTEFGGHKWTLANGAKKILKDLPWTEWFVRMKKDEENHKVGSDDGYWELRAKYDSLATVIIAERMWEKLTPQQRMSCKIEGGCLVPFANSWVNGILVDTNELLAKAPRIHDEMEEIEYRLGVRIDPKGKECAKAGVDWLPSPTLRSPDKLRDLLYDVWKLTPNPDHFTKGGESGNRKAGTSKAALTYLADDPIMGDKIISLMRWKELNTILTKFVNGADRFVEYLKSSVMHPSPNLFSTYTGRVTYSSKVLRKYSIGMALHQIPRGPEIRSSIKAPDGYKIVEADAAGQELRFMAELSKDPTLLQLFNSSPPKDDAHSYTGAGIAGIAFEDFLKAKAEKVEEIVGPHGFRYLGKFCYAEGQLVATDSGWKPVENLTVDDLVWDGVEFVEHDGVMFVGYRDVITVQGLTATPDHTVIMEDGSEAYLEDVKDGTICREDPYNEGGDVWRAGSYIGSVRSKKFCAVRRVSMFLRKRVRVLLEQSEAWEVFEMQKMWRERVQTSVLPNSIQKVSRYSRQMLERVKSFVSKLRGSWDRMPLLVPKGFRGVRTENVSRYEFQRVGHRQREQRRPLRTWKFETCSEKGKPLEQKKQQDCRAIRKAGSCLTRLARLKRCLSGIFLPSSVDGDFGAKREKTGRSGQVRCGEKREEGKVPVYDIINAGPRHRVVVQGLLTRQCNLSYMYRIGDKSARIKARVDYGIDETIETIKKWKGVFFGSYPGIRRYWNDAIFTAKTKGYAETLGGRRFYIDQWNSERWASEQSSINTPIQGSGGDMKELAVYCLSETMPELIFAWDLHDGIFYYLKEELCTEESLLKMRTILDNLPYEKTWGWKPSLPMLWDVSYGDSWKSMTELKR